MMAQYASPGLFMSVGPGEKFITFDTAFRLDLGTGRSDLMDDTDGQGMQAIYAIKYSFHMQPLQVLDSGIVFLQHVSATWHYDRLFTLSVNFKKVIAELGVKRSFDRASSSAGPVAPSAAPAGDILATPSQVQGKKHLHFISLTGHTA